MKNWFRISQEVEEIEDPFLLDIIDENKWEYKAYGPGYWTFGDYSIDADTPLEDFKVQYEKSFLGQEDTFEKAMQLALDHYQGYLDASEEKTVTPYEIIEKNFGFTDNPQKAGYIMADGQMVNLNRPHIDHRAVTIDGTTKSMQEFMAEGNIRMSFQNGYLFLDIKSKPTEQQFQTIYEICEKAINGANISIDNGMNEFNSTRETYSETDNFVSKQFNDVSPDNIYEFITSYYSGRKKYDSPLKKFYEY